jgi:hypothetical protein
MDPAMCRNPKELFALLLAAGLLVSGTSAAHSDDEHSTDALKAHSRVTAQGDRCVRDTDVMRKQHFEFILHQRDKTMRRGIRTTRDSLKNCVNCHADPATGSVLGEKGFCQECHSYAAVKIDCFGCHTDKAQPGVKPIPALGRSNAISGDPK